MSKDILSKIVWVFKDFIILVCHVIQRVDCYVFVWGTGEQVFVMCCHIFYWDINFLFWLHEKEAEVYKCFTIIYKNDLWKYLIFITCYLYIKSSFSINKISTAGTYITFVWIKLLERAMQKPTLWFTIAFSAFACNCIYVLYFSGLK